MRHMQCIRDTAYMADWQADIFGCKSKKRDLHTITVKKMRLAYQYCVRQLTDLKFCISAGDLLVGLIWLSVFGLLTEDRLIDDRGVALITLISTSL